jgi:hypothetical protein
VRKDTALSLVITLIPLANLQTTVLFPPDAFFSYITLKEDVMGNIKKTKTPKHKKTKNEHIPFRANLKISYINVREQ